MFERYVHLRQFLCVASGRINDYIQRVVVINFAAKTEIDIQLSRPLS